jgi:hypothetical protein
LQYGSSLLTGINVGDQISGLTFRIVSDTVRNSSPASTFTNWDLTLAQAVNTVPNMSTTFADNMLNPVQVRNGSLSFSAGAFQGGAVNPTTNPFGPVITFSTPYTYQGGDLVVLISHTPGSLSIGGLDALSTSSSGYGTDYRAFTANSFNGISGLQISMTITQFTTAPATPVPFEFSPALGLGVLGGLFAVKKFVKRKKSYDKQSIS